MKTKTITYIRPNFDKRFAKSFYSRSILKNVKQLKNNLVVFSNIENLTKPLSSINYNNYLMDTKNNIETIASNLENIKSYFNLEVSKFCLEILKEGRKFEDILVSFQNKKYNHIFNYFLSSYHISPTIEDPLTKVILDGKYKAHYYPHAGYGPSIKNKYRIPISSISKDSQDSIIGESVLEDKIIYNTDKKICGYKLAFESIDSDFRNFAHSRTNELKLVLNVNIFGYQKINSLSIDSSDNLIISHIYFIDNNETLMEITNFTEIETTGNTTIYFTDIVTSNLKIEFALKEPKDIISTKFTDSRLYSLYIKNISLYYSVYNSVSYFDTPWINISNFGSLKYDQKLYSNSDEFIIENYLLVDSIKQKYLFLISENYNDWIYSSLYVKNNSAIIPAVPSEFEVYKNETLLTESTDYSFYSSLNEDPISLADIDNTKTQYLTIKLTEFDPSAFYFIKYKVFNNIIGTNVEFYNQNSIIFNKPFTVSKIKFITCFRKRSSRITKIPIIKSLFIRTNNVS